MRGGEGALEALAAGGEELEPSKRAVGAGEALGGPPPPCLPHGSPQRNSSSCSKAPRPSSRQVLAEFSLPPSLRERLHPLSTPQAGAESAAPLPRLHSGTPAPTSGGAAKPFC